MPFREIIKRLTLLINCRKAISHLSSSVVFNRKGFTLIELLIVVAIIGILAAIAIPGYIGMQEKSKKGAIVRSATSALPELQSWLVSSKSGNTATEVDTDFSGTVVSTVDKTNAALGISGAASAYCAGKLAPAAGQSERGPWDGTVNLWLYGATATSGRINIYDSANNTLIYISASDSRGNILLEKVVNAD